MRSGTSCRGLFSLRVRWDRSRAQWQALCPLPVETWFTDQCTAEVRRGLRVLSAHRVTATGVDLAPGWKPLTSLGERDPRGPLNRNGCTLPLASRLGGETPLCAHCCEPVCPSLSSNRLVQAVPSSLPCFPSSLGPDPTVTCLMAVLSPPPHPRLAPCFLCCGEECDSSSAKWLRVLRDKVRLSVKTRLRRGLPERAALLSV